MLGWYSISNHPSFCNQFTKSKHQTQPLALNQGEAVQMIVLSAGIHRYHGLCKWELEEVTTHKLLVKRPCQIWVRLTQDRTHVQSHQYLLCGCFCILILLFMSLLTHVHLSFLLGVSSCTECMCALISLNLRWLRGLAWHHILTFSSTHPPNPPCTRLLFSFVQTDYHHCSGRGSR